MAYDDVLVRIRDGLDVAMDIFQDFTPGAVKAETKKGGDPVTEADMAVDTALRELLPQEGEGWLSEETVDDLTRLTKERVWIVDPLDGTKEFVAGIPEWSVSIAYSVAGRIVAAGICNPVTRQRFVGSEGGLVKLNGDVVGINHGDTLVGSTILASRSEVNRGQWQPFANEPFTVIPTGSVAYKLALVAAGKADATFSLAPKNEWDIAAGVFLVELAGGRVTTLDNKKLIFNQKRTLVNGIVAANPALCEQIHELLASSP